MDSTGVGVQHEEKGSERVSSGRESSVHTNSDGVASDGERGVEVVQAFIISYPLPSMTHWKSTHPRKMDSQHCHQFITFNPNTDEAIMKVLMLKLSAIQNEK